jgi:hypothetical protein
MTPTLDCCATETPARAAVVCGAASPAQAISSRWLASEARDLAPKLAAELYLSLSPCTIVPETAALDQHRTGQATWDLASRHVPLFRKRQRLDKLARRANDGQSTGPIEITFGALHPTLTRPPHGHYQLSLRSTSGRERANGTATASPRIIELRRLSSLRIMVC